jgi:hypothetical protein
LTRHIALVICLVVLVACAVTGVAAYAVHQGPTQQDFFGIWSWARFVIERPVARIYDHAEQHAFLQSLNPPFTVPFPFPYPPTYLLLIRPLGWLSYTTALHVWTAVTFLAYVAAVCGLTGGRAAAILAIIAPAAAVNAMFGQNGFLTAALLLGGAGLMASRPILAGVLLGLLSYKPQFGLVIGVALAAAGMWRTALAAAVTVGAMVAASLAAFGVEPWIAWLRALPDFVAIVDEQRGRLAHLIPTARSDALALGATEQIANLIQAAVTAAAAVAVWITFRRGSGPLAVAALAFASVLAAPYAFLYDLTIVAVAVALIVAERLKALSAAELVGLTAVILLPAAMFLQLVPPVATVVHAAALAGILMHLRRDRRMAATRATVPAAD